MELSYADFCRSKKQKEVMRLYEEGLSSRKIADRLKMDDGSVRLIVRRAKAKAAKAGYSPDHGMTETAPDGFHVKGTSTLYRTDEETGEKKPVMQWVKTNADAQNQLEAIQSAVDDIVAQAEGRAEPKEFNDAASGETETNLANLYITNDLHFGALAWAEETLDQDYDLSIAEYQLDHAMKYLTENAPRTKVGIVADLGDLTEMDDFKNSTPYSGHSLDVDGRFSKVMRSSMDAMVRLVEFALERHELVYFYNIAGNHDVTNGHAVRAFVEAWYRNEPRVVVDTSPSPIKYHQHGSTLLGFAHGDGLKMNDAGEAMVMHNEDIFSDTKNRFFHFGHFHKDIVRDGRICKAESHRNIAPLNAWASHKGFGRQLGTMKAITYCKERGEVSRTLYNVTRSA